MTPFDRVACDYPCPTFPTRIGSSALVTSVATESIGTPSPGTDDCSAMPV